MQVGVLKIFEKSLFYVFTAAPWVVIFVAAAVILVVAVVAFRYFKKSQGYN